MAGTFDIKVNKRQLAAAQKALADIPRGMPRVMSKSINLTLVNSRTELVQRMRDFINMKARAIKKGIATNKATFSVWAGSLDISTRRVKLIDFAARQTRKGITYKISKMGGRKLIKSAFVAEMQSGHIGVFRRKKELERTGTGKLTGKALLRYFARDKERRENRLPIVELKGPSLGIAFEQSGGLLRKVLKGTHNNLRKNIDSQIEYVLSKRRKSA